MRTSSFIDRVLPAYVWCVAGGCTLGVILLTGGTGLIGGAVLHRALQSDDGHLWRCLVRARSVEEGRGRLARRLARFTDPGTAAAMARRVEIVPGDVNEADLDDDPRLDGVTHVLHLAADTSWCSDDRVHRTNHGGTLSLARRARRMPRLRRLLHVGTAMICGDDPAPLVAEDDHPDGAVRHLVGYTASKALAEASLRDLFPDLPVVIARPSIVAGHSSLGARPSSSILWLVRAIDRLRLLPCEPEAAVDIVPVDWTAEALLKLLFKDRLAHGTYHLSAGAGAASRWSAVARAFEAADPAGGRRHMRRIDLPRDRALLRSRFAECFGLDSAVKLTMLRAFTAYARFSTLDVAFSNDRLLAEGVPRPPSLPDYLAACLEGDIVERFVDDLDMFASPAPAPRRRMGARSMAAPPPHHPRFHRAVLA